MSFAVGSLVKARSREWEVLPGSSDDLLLLKPLGGADAETAGILTSLEEVEPATFAAPDPNQHGDYRSCRLLRDSARLVSRFAAGPFRSFARIAVEPRPYQLVPLLMALKLEPVRLLIADDVGVGKTIEACLIARELIDRGELERFVVLCPPHLAPQWQAELATKFHLDAEVLLPSTASRLERAKVLRLDESVFDVYPRLIVSTDYIKSPRRREDFLRACPGLVIVDEAHGFAFAGRAGSAQHQRHELLKALAKDQTRHLVLVTATPHSGKEDAFRSLLTFLDPEFSSLPEDLSGSQNEKHRRRLAGHLVQRRRADIRSYLASETPFPERETAEDTYQLSTEYRRFFERVLEFAREVVRDESGEQVQRRVRWWSALALLRSCGSSPAAAAATLRNRAASAQALTLKEADEIGRRTVLDEDLEETADATDVIPGSDYVPEGDEDTRTRRKLQELARQADSLHGAEDLKLERAVALTEGLLSDGYHPILFCRYISTAEYVAENLRERLSGVEVMAVTGLLPPADREERVAELAKAEKHVLVCTDCLSEGVNLQEHFTAVVHYDLSWNPTRHEQREGRVDRYGQPASTVRVLTYYGRDNQIDGIVLEVLLRKHAQIRKSTGVAIPVPNSSETVMEAILEGLLLRDQAQSVDEQMTFLGEFFKPRLADLHTEWEAAADKEKRSRSMFAQETIKPEEVARELDAARAAVGSKFDLEAFVRSAVEAHRGRIERNGSMIVVLEEAPLALKDRLQPLIDPEGLGDFRFEATFDSHRDQGLRLNRTHPVVEALAAHTLDSALDPLVPSAAARCGALRTTAVQRRTTVLLARCRFRIREKRQDDVSDLLAEDCRVLAFEGPPSAPEWLEAEQAEGLLEARPSANLMPDQIRHHLGRILEDPAVFHSQLDEVARNLAAELEDSHRRVRSAARLTGLRSSVEPTGTPDLLGVYVLLPAGGDA